MAQAEQEVGMSPAELWDAIKRYKHVIFAAPLICGIAAYVLVTFIMAPQWEASAIIQVGQVGQVGQIGQVVADGTFGSIAPKLVEPIANVVVRMQNSSFALDVLKQTNFNSDELSTATGIFKNSIKVEKAKDSELVEFKLKGYSPEMARTLAINSVSYLQKIHDEMMSPGLVRIKTQIQIANEDMQALRRETDSLSKKLQDKHDWNSYNATLAATVLQDKSNQLRGLTQRKLLLTEQLSPSVTFSTHTVGDISISDAPVSPKKPLIISLAILIGLLGGIFIAFMHNAVSKSRA